ncbi:MAG: hypothetical protein PHV18_04660 [Lachnospiraceae bacterium]|nr:hypothetical protein [Lachnospiraceae bacterium]
MSKDILVAMPEGGVRYAVRGRNGGEAGMRRPGGDEAVQRGMAAQRE